MEVLRLDVGVGAQRNRVTSKNVQGPSLTRSNYYWITAQLYDSSYSDVKDVDCNKMSITAI